MKKSLPQKIISKVRNATPVFIRQKIGPILAYMMYIDRIYIRPNSKKPDVLSLDQTLDRIINHKLSVIRFGDGEITLLDGADLPFQKKYPGLAERLEEIIKTTNENLMICIPGIWGKLDKFADFAYFFIMHHQYRYHHIWKNLISYDRTYGNAYISRPYLAFKDRTDSGRIFKKFFSIWQDQNIVLIEGEKSRLGVGNDLFNNVRSIKRILCPPENAYLKYDEIKNEALKINKDVMILLSLGPAAKLLAYDLFKAGYRVIDVGHIDMEYEMFLRKEYRQTKVPFKYFNEINERNPEDCHDEKYINQIITTIK